MKRSARSTLVAAFDRVAPATADKFRTRSHGKAQTQRKSTGQPNLRRMKDRIDELEREVQECRRLNRRLSDVVDVVTELLVPALDRDEDKVREALSRFEKVV